MENRERNEEAFNELLEEIGRRSSSYYASSISDLRDHYKNTNPFYLFSNQFHDLIMKFVVKLKEDKKFDIRKCVKEIIQELTFYKIACPLKHLRLANSNIPSLVASLKSSPHPADICQEKAENSNGKRRDNKELEGNPLVPSNGIGFVNNFAVEMSKLKTCESNESLNVNCRTMNVTQEIENALKSIPEGVTTIINIKNTQVHNHDRKFNESNPSNVLVNHDTITNAKRKIGDIIKLREDEISRKKTSSGQSLIRIRKETSEHCNVPLEIHKSQNEAIYIIDDDADDDVIIKSCFIQSKKNSIRGDPTNSLGINSSRLKNKSLIISKDSPRSGKNSTIANDADDDVFIVEDVDLTGSEREFLAGEKSHSTHIPSYQETQNEDVIILKSYNIKPFSCH